MSRRSQQQPGGKPSIAFYMIRHAESNNNKVYGDAKNLFRFGSPDFDKEGFMQYVDTHRRADPQLSPLGMRQADALADEYLNPALFEHLASSPVRILCSPMTRTLLTIRPAIERLVQSSSPPSHSEKRFQQKIHLIIVSFYHEIEGCHTKGKPEPGMSPAQIREFMFQNLLNNRNLSLTQSDIDEIVKLDFVGFDSHEKGWYTGTGHESRIDAEARAAKYCLWLTNYLDTLMYHNDTESDEDLTCNDDLFDVGFLLPGEDEEDEQDKFVKRLRRRRTVLAIGHGDFMSVILKRLVGGFVGCGKGGRLVEQSGLPHRTAFAHYNTGITELEYFGHSRFIVMTTNVTPHISPALYRDLRSGGTLRDGWAFAVPPLPEISIETNYVAGSNRASKEEKIRSFHDHDQEQIIALKALYLSSSSFYEELESPTSGRSLQFIVKRGFQVLAVATYSEWNGLLTDVAVRPSSCVLGALLRAIKEHSHSLNLQGDVHVRPRTPESISFFQKVGFTYQTNHEEQLEENSGIYQQSIMILAEG